MCLEKGGNGCQCVCFPPQNPSAAQTRGWRGHAFLNICIQFPFLQVGPITSLLFTRGSPSCSRLQAEAGPRFKSRLSHPLGGDLGQIPSPLRSLILKMGTIYPVVWVDESYEPNYPGGAGLLSLYQSSPQAMLSFSLSLSLQTGGFTKAGISLPRPRCVPSQSLAKRLRPQAE